MLYYKLVEAHLKDARIAVSDGKQEYTFLQLHKRVRSCAAYLRSRGLLKGERVLLADLEPLETVVLLLACISEGYIFVPVGKQMTWEEREEIINSCSPTLVISGRTDFEKAIVETEVVERRNRLPEDTPVYIIYTSGTEGRLKGVCGSQKQILFCSEAINRRLGNHENDRILCSLPLSFDYGLYQVFLALLSGARLYLHAGDVLQSIPYVLREWKITGFPTLPSAAGLLVRAGLLDNVESLCLRYITFTGEVLPVSLIQNLRKAMPDTAVIPMYGMTECKRAAVMPPEREDKIMAGSCGLPLEGVRVWLKDKDVQSGIGELVVEGPNVMEGYWGISDEDSGIFSVNEETGERRIYTGDLFRIDEEGFLYFYGRRNSLLKIRGYRISSQWIENCVRKAPGVIEAAVCGVPDRVTGERAVIFVYAVDEAVREEVLQNVRVMPSYLWNTRVFLFLSPLPRNGNGKIDVKRLRLLAEEKKL